MIGKKKATLHDVAARAAVSTATVSRCLNTPGAVRPAVREQVAAAIAELGYVPHGAARALASQRSRTIGAVVPTLDNAIFATGIQRLQKRLVASGYTLLLASSNYDTAQELDEVRALVSRGLDGLVLVGSDHHPALLQLLRDERLPYVHTWTYDATVEHPCVGFDNRRAAARMARYLLDLGHREFAVVSGITRNNNRAAERLQGVRETLSAAGVELRDERLLERRYSLADGREALTLLMAQRRPPSALICGNDVLALGALFGAQSLGIDVPGRLSISGFDDLPLASQVCPALSTMQVPAAEMGLRAAEYLLARIAGESPPDHTRLEINVVVRDTTAPPAAAPSATD